MSDRNCERCGATPKFVTEGPFAGGLTLFDYCAVCSKNLCDDCMAKGHCGHTPARSGFEEDFNEANGSTARSGRVAPDAEVGRG